MKRKNVFQAIFDELGVTKEQIQGPNRKELLVDARFLVYFFLRNSVKGQEMCEILNRKRLSVLHYREEIDGRIKFNNVFRDRYIRVKKELNRLEAEGGAQL